VPSDPADLARRQPAALLRAVRSDDLAVHHEVADPGPDPLTRDVVGLLLGAAVGAAAALLTRRHEG